MQDIPIINEQEAAVAILFASVMTNNNSLSQYQVEQLSRMLVLSSKFRSAALNDLTINAMSEQAAHGSKLLIETSAPLISEDFRETLFAMCCELVTANGKLDETESDGTLGEPVEETADVHAGWVALVDRIRSGKIDGMEELYQLFSRGIRFYLCRQLGPQELDDKVHDTFVVVVLAIRR